MSPEYAEYYQQASDTVAEISETVSGYQFDETQQAVEIYVLQALAICQDRCRAIALLLKANFFAEPITLSRSLFELLFGIHWVQQATSSQERLERVYQLEAHPYYEFNKEVRFIERDVIGPTPHWNPGKLKEFQDALDYIRTTSSFLIDSATNEFKQAPPLAARMGDENRLRFYHLYRFTSLFTHPTPTLKQVYLRPSGSNQTVADIIGEPLNQALAYGLLFVELIGGYFVEILEPYNAHLSSKREQCYRRLFDLVERGNKGYFGTSKHKPVRDESNGKTAAHNTPHHDAPSLINDSSGRSMVFAHKKFVI